METALTVAQPTSIDTGVSKYKIYPVQIQLMQSNHLSTFPDAVLGAFRDVKSGKQWVQLDENQNPVVDKHGRKIPASLRIIPLAKQDQRLYYLEGTERVSGAQPLCKSINGIVPITGALAERMQLIPQASLCNKCPKSDWSEYHNKNSQSFHKKEAKPPCVLRPQLLFCEKVDELPYFTGFATKSIAPLDNLLQSIARDIQSHANKSVGPTAAKKIREQGNPNNELYELYDYTVDLGAEQVTERGFTFQRVTFRNLTKCTPEEKGKYRFLFEEYVYGSITEPPIDNVDQIIEGEVQY